MQLLLLGLLLLGMVCVGQAFSPSVASAGRWMSTSKIQDTPISPNKLGVNFNDVMDGSKLKIAIVRARWNDDIISGLYSGVKQSLAAAQVSENNIHTTYVPGAFEVPVMAKYLALSKEYDAIVCLGCLIKGETMHFEYIAQAASTGIMQISLETLTPCVFGVLTVLNKEQAIARSSGSKNEGLSWGNTAVEMGLKRQEPSVAKLLSSKPKRATKT